MMQAQDNRVALLKGRLREKWMEKRQALLQAIAEILRQGAGQGQIRTDLPPEVLAGFLLGVLRTREIDLRELPQELRRYELVVDLFLHGATARVESLHPVDSPPRSEAPRSLASL